MVSPIRLLFVTAESWPTFRPDVAALFGKYLPRYGVCTDLVTYTREARRTTAWQGGHAYLCHVPDGARKYLRAFVHLLSQLVKTKRKDYAAIQVRDMPILGACAMVVSRLKGLPFYYWMSYPYPEGYIGLARERGMKEGLAKWLFPWVRGRLGRVVLYQYILPRAHHVFVQSASMKAEMIERGVPSEKITDVPMGVDIEAIKAVNIEAVQDKRLAGRRVLVYLGTLDRTRQIEVLFEMLSIIKTVEPNALLVLVGDTNDSSHRSWLRRQAMQFGVEQDVIWTGWLPTAAAWAYVASAEVAFSPIPRGPLLDISSPTKVPEYLALGVPVVCNDNPDQADVIARSGAGRCVVHGAQGFATATLELLRLRDADMLDSEVEAGRQFVARYRSYSAIAEELVHTYRKLASGTHQSSQVGH